MERKKNQGFTLLELIVVIAIMAVALGITGMSLGVIQQSRSKGCAQEMKSSLEMARTSAMAKGGGSVTIYKDTTTGDIMMQTTGGDSRKIGGSSLTVTYGFKGDSDVYTLGSEPAGKELKVTFSASSGSISDTNSVEWIRINGNKKYKLTLYKLTGKVTMETE